MSIPTQRQVLPIPDRAANVPATYDAKDPDTAFPPIEPLRPPEGAPNVLIVLVDDCGFGASSAFGGPVAHADVRAAGGRGAALHPVPHHGAVLARPGRRCCRVATTTRVGDGRHHRDRDLGAGVQLDAAQRLRAAGGDAEAQRLLDRAVRQVPRGAGVADQPDGAVRQLAVRRWRVRALLRLHRRGDEPVRARRCTRTPRRSSRTGPRRRATTSPRTSPTTRSPGCASRRR